MPKLNKVFLAIVVALLVTAVAETLFIFVYKPSQTIPTPISQTPVVTPTPLPLGVSGKTAASEAILNRIKSFAYFKNMKLTYTEEYFGKIKSIGATQKTVLPSGYHDDPSFYATYPKSIYFAEWQPNNTDYIKGISFKLSQWDNLQVFDIRNGGHRTINVSDLVPGDSIRAQYIFNNLSTSNGIDPDAIVIYRE